jgi:GH35 family endo-1,4-beta-xylanase
VGSPEYIEAAFYLARKTAPSKRLMLNESGIFGSGQTRHRNREKYFDLLKTLIEKGVPIDVIGIQAHANGEWYEPANVAGELDRYSALGKPIQITEFSAQIFNYDDRETAQGVSGNYRSGVWDAEKQAEFYREFYTIAFGHPQVEAIIQWGLDDERAWLPGIGVIDKDGNPKPNYRVLDRLINERWRTNLQAESRAAAEPIEFRGFYGTYEIEATINGRTTKTKFDLKKKSQNEWTLRL